MGTIKIKFNRAANKWEVLNKGECVGRYTQHELARYRKLYEEGKTKP